MMSNFQRSFPAVKRMFSVKMKISNVNVGFVEEVIRNNDLQFRGNKHIALSAQ
jgi:hypothetical protein